MGPGLPTLQNHVESCNQPSYSSFRRWSGIYDVSEIPAQDTFLTATDNVEEGLVFNGEDPWYDYDFTTHVLTPKADRTCIYRQPRTFRSNPSYYDDAGTPLWFPSISKNYRIRKDEDFCRRDIIASLIFATSLEGKEKRYVSIEEVLLR